jgi:hypothetical protein
MHLVFHQFRYDLRRHRWLIYFWLALLGLDLAANLGWLGKPNFDQNNAPSKALLGFVGLAMVLWIAVILFPTLFALSDSPARVDGFLATRPLGKWELTQAKILLVLSAIAFPGVLQEFLHLLLQGLPFQYVCHGMIERLVFVVPITVFAAAFAGLWVNLRQWSLSLVLALVGTWAFVLLRSLPGLGGLMPSVDFNGTTVLVGLWSLAAGGLLLMVANQYRRWVLWRRWCGTGVLLLVIFLLAGICGRDWFAVPPAASALAAQAVSPATVSVPPGGVRIHAQTPQRLVGRHEFEIALTPRLDSLRNDEVAEWHCREFKFALNSGQNILGRPAVTGNQSLAWNPAHSTTDLRAFSSLLGSEPIFCGTAGIPGETSVALGTIALATESLPESFRLEGALEADVFRWQRVGELGLVPGETIRDTQGLWRFLRVNDSDNFGNRLVIERQQITLSTTHDPRIRRSLDLPFDQHEFVLYRPEKPEATLVDFRAPSLQIGLLTAYIRSRIELSFRPLRSRNSDTEFNQDYRLVIFRREFQRKVRIQWNSPTLSGRDFQINEVAQPWAANQTMTRPEFLKGLKALTPPSPNAPRLEVGRYLNDVLRLVEARHYLVLSESDPVVNLLIPFVPKHLSAFLDGEATASHLGRRVMIAAIIQGAEAGQKAEIVQAMRMNPNLIEVILARDWMREAKEVLYELARSGRSLPLEVIQAVASFEDPQTYPWLLDHFRMGPNVSSYDLLSRLPGIQDRLLQTVDQLWRERPPLFYQYQQALPAIMPVALRQGKPEALREAYRFFEFSRTVAGINDESLSDALMQCIHTEDLLPDARHDYSRVANWLTRFHAEEFRFNPGRRQFVLKSE